MERLKVVLFAGGRGSASIGDSLLNHPQIELSLVINAYDDGLSTGMMRRLVPGMLGPSDIRKNLSRMIPQTDAGGRALRNLLEYRFPQGQDRVAAIALMQAMTGAGLGMPAGPLRDWYRDLPLWKAEKLSTWLTGILDWIAARVAEGQAFEIADCSLGNLVFSGCFIAHGRSFNAAIAEMSKLCEAKGRVLNVTDGKNLVLMGLKADGTMLVNEAEIVSPQNEAALSELFLLPDYLLPAEATALRPLPLESKRAQLRERSRAPAINEDVRQLLATADIVIYGPGTQHSSLFPSYLTEGVAEAIASNTHAEKVFVGNILKDHEIKGDTANSLIDKFIFYMNRKRDGALAWDQMITRFFFQGPGQKAGQVDYITFQQSEFKYPIERVVITDWEVKDGVHSGGRVLDELIAVVNTRLDAKIRDVHYMVSIVVPGLDEARTVKKVLHDLMLLDFLPLGLTKEVLYIDGGSTDGSFELASSEPGVKAHRLEGKSGRGLALREGVRRAAGNIIVFFPSDNEYDAPDLLNIVSAVARDGYDAVFGSRAIKCIDLTDRIREIYQGNRLGYLASKYGGILISVGSLLFYNRFVSDAFTGIKAFKARTIKSLDLRCDGLDMDTELVAKLSKRRLFILELPVGYRARKKSEGKKTTMLDGVKAIWVLFKLRFTE